MKFSFVIKLAIALLFVPAAVFSQGSGSSEPSKSTGSRKRNNNFVVTRSVTGVVESANAGSVVVKANNGKTSSLIITTKTRVDLRCLTGGQKVTVIYTPNNRTATAVRCR